MNSVAHAAVGAFLFGPVGAVASVLPDAPMAVVWVISRGNRVRLPRTHWAMRAQRWFHSLFILPLLAALGFITGVGLYWIVAAVISWLLHIWIDYLTHPRKERWPLL